MTPNDRLKSLLSDLGKSTLRGIKKCPKCGTYNGTRGLCCKNKACDAVFKEAGEKRKNSTEVCKLVTGYSTQIFSVRIRDKGPDYRGFVQLPIIADNIPYDEALCFVEACQRTFQAHLGCHEKFAPVIPICQHIDAALRCYTLAQPLDITEESIASLNMSTQMKEAVWQLKTESTSPIVQRVSRHIMAVKCESNSKHPLGYLHVSFFLSKTKDCQIQYSCSCPFYKTKSGRTDPEGFQTDLSSRRCVHYYACVAAFAGDAKLSEEFAVVLEVERPAPDTTVANSFLSLELLEPSDEVIVPDDQHEDDEQQQQQQQQVANAAADDVNSLQLVAIFSDVVNSCEVEVEMLPVETSLLQHILPDDISQMQGLEVVQNLDMCVNDQLVMEQPRTVLVNQKSLNQLLVGAQPASIPPPPVQIQLRTPTAQRQTDADIKCNKCKPKDDNNSTVSSNENAPKKLPIPAKRKRVTNHGLNEVYDEHGTNIMFLEWLSSVTESINESMHYQCSGAPDPLIFRCPQKFFECLKERISNAGMKKRLPNSTTVVTRKDTPPFGKFTKYTWIINNVIHLKHIFETPQVPLVIARSFIKHSDGSYDLYNASSSYEHFAKTENSPRIKPLEYKTYLKVGYNFKEQSKPTPFSIEWTPDILPVTRTGELKLTFQFGHHSPLSSHHSSSLITS
ncbi:hypothetical protein LSTR_LSTR008326 [Laodelphax striatellus]|uniref:SWIM-type domain-containing protein n=1 Tax=Laodelphax striatellus TaxID=195883 RepID=A0A482XKG1_LAOST|nr:hypothetical protein LSTR_LSTR008326 [Laodelphax striatellus]